MQCLYMLILVILPVLAGCSAKPLPPVEVQVPERMIDYVQEVRPVLERRCVVCHSCYNSPCQLKLSSFDGIDRGATKKSVYDAGRMQAMDPTRLFIDAKDTGQWRQKGFFSVTTSEAVGKKNDSVMLQLLAHKMHTPESEGDYYPEQDLTCPENGAELGVFLEKHPNRGMPFGFPPLREEEFQLVAGWLAQGARGPSQEQMQVMNRPGLRTAAEIAYWEAFLNTPDVKHRVTARYLYEHLFLAHIWFSAGDGGEFYELVRSTTGPGLPIEVIPTVRPYDDPGSAGFFYRFRKIHSTIVHKTHMVFTLNDAVLARQKALFIKPQWEEEPHDVGYAPESSANPFETFAQIPPRARYRFLLDNAHYIIMTFIHGPVCKGQIALNVVQDHFWLLFLDPDHDLSVRFPRFLQDHRHDLKMPIEQGSNADPLEILESRYAAAAKRFYRHRQDLYAAYYPDGLDVAAIWKGERPEDGPLLTVFRHFDSASVHKGALGRLPRTLWVMDYPLLERIYYALVAGFDVYGNAFHQVGVRLYMDKLRIEGESYFLDFLPPEQRDKTMREWYDKADFFGVGYFPANMPAGFTFRTTEPKRELIEHLVDSHLRKDTGIGFDPNNYLRAGVPYPPLPGQYREMKDYLQGFRAVSAPGTAFFRLIDDHNVNTAFIRIRLPDGDDKVVSVVIHRWHDNVKFMIPENLFLDATKDEADFFEGFIGSYPNYFFDLSKDDLPDFFALLHDFQGSAEDVQRLEKFGVNRADKRFWEVYDWFQDRFRQTDPIRSGLFDLNRYYHRAM